MQISFNDTTKAELVDRGLVHNLMRVPRDHMANSVALYVCFRILLELSLSSETLRVLQRALDARVVQPAEDQQRA